MDLRSFCRRPLAALAACLSLALPLLLAGCAGGNPGPSSSAVSSSIAQATVGPTAATTIAPSPATAATTIAPSPAPPLYPALSISVSCTKNYAVTYVITGGLAPDLAIEIAGKPDFSDVPWGGPNHLDAATYTYASSFLVNQFPDGIYVRYQMAPEITAHGNTSGSCGLPANSQAELSAACANGTAISGATALGEATHPEIEGSSGIDSPGAWTFKPGPGATWDNFQLIACESRNADVDGVSCGTYSSNDLSETTEVTLTQESYTVKVLSASTGQTLHSKTFLGGTKCPASVVEPFGGSTTTWLSAVDFDVVDAWIASYTKISGS